jgi:predicted methyltransferase
MRTPALTLCLALVAACATNNNTTSAPTTPPAAEPAPPAPPPPAPAADDIGSKITAVLAMPHRSEANRARDKYRHPVETLGFFGLRDDMTVMEIWPGGGWYTEVLAPLLKEKGKLLVTNTKSGTKYADMLASHPDLYGKVEVKTIAPPNDINFGESNSVDMLVTFRNIHNWMGGNTKYDGKVFAEAFRVLKKGGTFGVVEHRAKPGAKPEDLKGTGYVPEDYVIKQVEAVGFKLAAKSEINANPKDTKDYPQGVWGLPPTLRPAKEGATLSEEDKAKMLAIGESDRMTLKFVKP